MIYFDNGATTYPKPSIVFKSSVDALNNYSFNSGRGGYKQSIRASEEIFSVRERIGEMFGFSPENVAFTKNCTEALNIAIKGSVKHGDHIVISSLEHNSVSRVVEELKNSKGITYDIADYSYDIDKTVDNFQKAINDKTSLVICMHSSNAFGVSFPISLIGKLCREKGVRFIVDGAQGAGVAHINAKRDNIDILCAPGHKCLYGIMGTGFVAFSDNVSINPLMQGGTGSSSLSLDQPDFSPDRYESGTLNNPGIISLGKGIEYINSVGIDSIYAHELGLARLLYNGLCSIDGVKLYTQYPEINRNMPILSFNLKDYTSEKTASLLAEYDICTRAGYHCSPLAHKHFGTVDNGTVRISLGLFNTKRDCDKFLFVVNKL